MPSRLSGFLLWDCEFDVKRVYNIAFVNSERWLAKSRVDITLCQHGKFPATLLLKFFVLYYKRNIEHFFRIDIQLYQHSWKLEKLDIVWKPVNSKLDWNDILAAIFEAK